MKTSAKRRGAPKLRAIQTSRHLQVTHHRHTGHLTPKRTTSYPMLFMIMLCVGVFLASWTRYVTADPPQYGPAGGSYDVHLSVPGPPPTQPATIDSPVNGAVFTDIPITVSGSCPVNTYETLYRNGAFSGVALCSAVGDYSIQTALFPGVNQLQVRDFSPTDVGGPMSNIVTVTYNPPTPPPATTSTSSGGKPAGSPGNIAEPLIFKTTFSYLGYYTGTTTHWDLDLEGGNPPYAISADWGDGQRSLISRPRAGTFTLDHQYKKAGGYKGSYVVNFSAIDQDSNQTFLQTMSIINNPPAGLGTTHKPTPTIGNGTTTYLRTLLRYVWPGYAIVLLMLISFWLGERREFSYLKHHKRLRRA